MKRTYLFPLMFLLTFAFMTSTSSCGGGGSAPSLLDILKGTTWQLGTITNTTTNTSANSKFASFTLSFNSAGTGGSISYTGDIDTGGPGSVSATVSYTIDNGTKTLKITGFTGALTDVWTAATSPFNVTTTDNTLSFSIALKSPKTGNTTYKFDLVKKP